MKSLILTLTLLFSMTAFAEICFVADSEVPQNSGLPEKVCVKSLETRLLRASDAGSFYKIKLTTDFGQWEDEVLVNKRGALKTVKILQDVDFGVCGGFQKTLLTFKLGSSLNLSSLELDGLFVSNRDQCHYSSEETSISYSKSF